VSVQPTQPLWCPTCGGREWTPVPGGTSGFSQIEVTCDLCEERYLFALNFFMQLARAEQERREREQRAPPHDPSTGRPFTAP
jgi:hypothetical protein